MKTFLAFALVLATLAPAASAQTSPTFTGKWEGTFTMQRPDGTENVQPVTFELTHKGKALTGTAGPPEKPWAIEKGAVADGKAPSRAALVTSALEREMRRLAAEQDAAILRQEGAEDDLDALVRWTVGHP